MSPLEPPPRILDFISFFSQPRLINGDAATFTHQTPTWILFLNLLLRQTFEFRLKKIKGNEKNIKNIKLNPIGWEIASYILEVVTNKTKDMVEATRFISLSCDEVNTCDQSPWFPFMRIWLKIGGESH
jgi:hypothetical protein